MSMYPRGLIFGVVSIGLLTGACASSVTIPDPGEDTTPPRVVVTAGAAGETARADAEGTAETLEVLAGTGVAVFGSARDDGGVELVSVEVLSGGQIEDEQSVVGSEIEKQGSVNNPLDGLFVAGQLQPGSGAASMELQGFGRDFSGNEAHSEVLTVDYLTPVQPSLSLGNSTVTEGDSVTVSWQVSGTNASGYTLTIPNAQGQMQSQSVSASGTQSFTVEQAGSYSVSIAASTRIMQTGSSSASATLQVNPPPQPEASLEANPANVCAGDDVQLSWTTANADQAELTPPGNSVSLSGSSTESVSSTTTYSLTATQTATGNSDTDQVTVNVIEPPSSININKTATTGSGGPGPDNWRTASISTQDISRDCEMFTSITKVRYTGTSSIAPGEWIRIRFEPDSGSSRETRFFPNDTSTDVFNGMDPRGTWKLIYSASPLMSTIPFRVTAE